MLNVVRWKSVYSSSCSYEISIGRLKFSEGCGCARGVYWDRKWIIHEIVLGDSPTLIEGRPDWLNDEITETEEGQEREREREKKM